ncbi:cystathionine beta-lyase [Hyphomonas sp. FCG-A18]|uniref:cystathionine beta-lyase n=1 Tax=Hyphomonas sp. FCG-A18 TaxID=3080019 RepID=UPI002B2BB9F7|nr:cystathionine beta-lyase [Hyphomonas sp. FCG-A18]
MKDETRLIHTRKDRLSRKIVNPPIERASTVLLPTRDALYGELPTYGRMGLTVHRELEAALRTLENAAHCRLTTNGLQACALAIASLVESGDHVLISDSLYGPTSRFCTRRLKAMGVNVTRFDPTVGAGIADLVQDNTKAIYLESPGSLTFDIMDTPAIVRVAKNRGLLTVFDNTWGVGLLHRPLDLGVDVVLQALTKYPVGHADALGGAVLTNSDRLANKINMCAEDWGISLSPDDAYTALRGLRTLPARLKQHEESAYTVARWLADRPEVATILHPGLESHPEHDLWKRDFKGANGLFGIILNETTIEHLDAFLEALKLFGMGFSWGGYESLLIPCCDQLDRLETDRIHNRPGPLLRLHIGLENVDDLISDLAGAFEVLSSHP